MKLLYAGRLRADKGVHTAIQAFGQVVNALDESTVLNLVGRGTPEYEKELYSLVRRYRLERRVQFLGPVKRPEIPMVLAGADVLVFPSEWEEPFARIVMEAMAAGLVVIGTTTGGTGEILLEGVTGLTFPAGDAGALGRQIIRLESDEGLRHRLAAAGRRRVAGEFTFERMVDKIEALLSDLARPDKG